MYHIKHKNSPCFIAKPEMPSLLTININQARTFSDEIAAIGELQDLALPVEDYEIRPVPCRELVCA